MSKKNKEHTRIVICPHCHKDHEIKLWLDNKNKIRLFEVPEKED